MFRPLIIYCVALFAISSCCLPFTQSATCGEPEWRSVPIDRAVHALAFDDQWLYAASDRQIFRVASQSPEQVAAVSFADVKIQHLQITGDALFLAGAFQIEYGFVAKLPLKELFKRELEKTPSAGEPRRIDSAAEWCVSDLPSPVTAMHVSSHAIAIGDRTGALRSLRLSSGELNWRAAEHSKLVTCVASIALPDASIWLASGDWGGKIVISDARDGKLIESYALHRDAITDLASLPGRAAKLVSASRDGTVRLWYVEQHRMVRFFRQPAPVLSLNSWQDGMVLAATRDAELLWIDTSTAECVDRVECPIDYIHTQATSSRHIAISNGRDKIFIANRPAL